MTYAHVNEKSNSNSSGSEGTSSPSNSKQSKQKVLNHYLIFLRRRVKKRKSRDDTVTAGDCSCDQVHQHQEQPIDEINQKEKETMTDQIKIVTKVSKLDLEQKRKCLAADSIKQANRDRAEAEEEEENVAKQEDTNHESSAGKQEIGKSDYDCSAFKAKIKGVSMYASQHEHEVAQFGRGLIRQDIMRRLLANDDDDERADADERKRVESENMNGGSNVDLTKEGEETKFIFTEVGMQGSGSNCKSSIKTMAEEKSLRSSQILYRQGLISQKTLKRMVLEEEKNAMEQAVKVMESQQRPEGEIRVAKKGLLSKKTMTVMSELVNEIHLSEAKPPPSRAKRDPKASKKNDFRRATFASDGEFCQARKELVSQQTRRRRTLYDTDEQPSSDFRAIFSKADFHESMRCLVRRHTMSRCRRTEDNNINEGAFIFKPGADILTEGQYFLGISMLVYMYSHLREKCRMGYTRCSMHEIDTHSVQSQYKRGEIARYLDANITKSAGSIIRVVIDELEDVNEDHIDHEIVGGQSKEYERQQTAQFRKWINDSRISHIDEETENMLREMKRMVARHRWKRAISMVILSYRISGGKPPRWDKTAEVREYENGNSFVDMKDVMRETMKKQSKYFKEGSVMNNLIESGIEVVWFSDLSQNDVVYGICVNREEKKIIIVFRGTVNVHNWSMNLSFDINKYRNPIADYYPGREDELSLHAGFALYLLRKRKDTGMSKMDEIFQRVERIGRELAPNGDYKLCITGHSLGGALATLCGFYFGAKPKFAHLSTIYIWTFASPRVGTQAFVHAYQYLERSGRIRHARFSCTNDIVPLIPHCNYNQIGRNGLQFYKHVGMRIQLHDTGCFGKWRIQHSLDVTYPLRHDWSSQMERALWNSLLANLNSPKKIKELHELTEHQKRLHFALTYRNALGASILNSDQKRKRIKTLDEYYLIRADIVTEGVAEEVVDINEVEKVKRRRKFCPFVACTC